MFYDTHKNDIPVGRRTAIVEHKGSTEETAERSKLITEDIQAQVMPSASIDASKLIGDGVQGQGAASAL